MRVLVVDHYGTVVGGAQTYARTAMGALRRRGHEVAFLHQLRVGAGESPLDEEAGTVARWCVEADGLGSAVSSALAWAPDVVYVQGLERELEDAIVGARPSVLYAHNYYGTCATGTKSNSRPDVHACERVFGPACLGLNYAIRCGVRDPRALLRNYRAQSARRDNLTQYRAVLVGSRWMEAEYLRHGVPRGGLHRVPCFPTTMRAEPRPTVERAMSGRVLLAGRLTQVKGGTLLVDALALASEALGRSLTLVVAGDGPEGPAIAARARHRGIKAELRGWLDSAAVARCMQEADVIAVPSTWPEPFGLAGIEAGALGLPAVGFAIGGIPDWLRPGESGELADARPPTAEGLAAALVRALRDPAHLAALSAGARRVAAEFSVDRHLDSLEAVFRDVVAGAPAGS